MPHYSDYMAEMFFCQVHFDAQFSLSNNHHLCVLCLFGGCKNDQDNNKTNLLKIKNTMLLHEFSNWKNKYD